MPSVATFASVVERPVAFLSDVHGNLPALEAVLTEIDRLEVEEVVVAGDLLWGGDHPLEVWRRLQGLHAHCTRGPSDTALATIDPAGLEPSNERERLLAERFAETRHAVGDLVLQQLRQLPETLRIPMIDGGEIVVVHGSPSDPSQEMSHDLSDEELNALIGDDPADLVVCGATHVPFDRVMDQARVVNVGSVGDAPEGRIAHYTVLTPRMNGPLVQQAWTEF